MKKGNQVLAKNNPAVSSAQSQTQAEKSASKAPRRARAGRVIVRVPMPQFLLDALDKEVKASGRTRDEICEAAVLAQLERFDSGDTNVFKGGSR